jgi:hypothetical protein
MKVSDYYDNGDIKAGDELKADLKKALVARATRVGRMPTPFIDFLSSKKWEFDSKMGDIMNSKTIIPKS